MRLLMGCPRAQGGTAKEGQVQAWARAAAFSREHVSDLTLLSLKHPSERG